jgi:hypothetical protein
LSKISFGWAAKDFWLLTANHVVPAGMPAVFLCCRDAASEKHRAFVTFGPVKSKNCLRKAE